MISIEEKEGVALYKYFYSWSVIQKKLLSDTNTNTREDTGNQESKQ
jgi:hypothetical protein